MVKVGEKGLELVELAPGVSADDIIAKTGCAVDVSAVR